MNSTWWDRDLGIGGRVLVKEDDKIVTKLVSLSWPIAKIPTLAPHFGSAAVGPFNKETQMVPIIGLESSSESGLVAFKSGDGYSKPPLIGHGKWSRPHFTSTQPPALVRAIGRELGLNPETYSSIVNWELELFDIQPATVAGINKEFISAGRIGMHNSTGLVSQLFACTDNFGRRQALLLGRSASFGFEQPYKR